MGFIFSPLLKNKNEYKNRNKEKPALDAGI